MAATRTTATGLIACKHCGVELGAARIFPIGDGTFVCEEGLTGACAKGFWVDGHWTKTLAEAAAKVTRGGTGRVYKTVAGEVTDELVGVYGGTA